MAMEIPAGVVPIGMGWYLVTAYLGTCEEKIGSSHCSCPSFEFSGTLLAVKIKITGLR